MAKTGSLFLNPPPPVLTTQDGRALFEWIRVQLDANQRRLNSPSETRLDVLYAEPIKPRPGMLVCADGTTWNPGSGEGLYRYTLAGTWAFVG